MPNCIFVSFFNSNNIGDLLISEKLTLDIENCGYEVEKCSYEGNFNITGNSNISVDKTSSVILNKIKNKFMKNKFWIEYEKKIKNCDALIIGGGNMIMDLLPESKAAEYFRRYVDIAKKYNKKVIVLSIGIGPFQTEKQRNSTIRALDKCDYVTFRDKESYQLGKSGNDRQYISVDPVYMMPVKNTDKETDKETEKRTIGIGVINTFLFNPSKEYYNHVLYSYVDLINKLLEKNLNVVVFSTELADSIMIDDVVNICNDNRVRKMNIQTSEELLNLYNYELSFIIAARMHSLIVAFTQYIPIIGLSWQQKVNSMFELIDKKDNCFPIDQILNNHGKILLLVKDGLNNKAVLDEETRTKLIDMKDKYEINNSILQSFKNEIKNSEVIKNV